MVNINALVELLAERIEKNRKHGPFVPLRKVVKIRTKVKLVDGRTVGKRAVLECGHVIPVPHGTGRVRCHECRDGHGPHVKLPVKP